MKLQYKNEGSKIIGREPISVQEHVKCECQCRVKKEVCFIYFFIYIALAGN